MFIWRLSVILAVLWLVYHRLPKKGNQSPSIRPLYDQPERGGDTLQDFEKRRHLILSVLRAQKNLSTATFFTKRKRSSKVSPPLSGVRFINYSLMRLSCLAVYSFAVIYPFAVKSSAERIAPPAAPRMVLWDSPTNL